MSEYDEQEVVPDVEPTSEDQGSEGETGTVEGPADPERFPSLANEPQRPEDKVEASDTPLSSYENE